MLLKAQTYGIKVERRSEVGAGLGKRTVRWFQRYKTPLTILAIAVAVFAGVLALSLYTSRLAGGNGGAASVPTEFRDMLSDAQRALLDGLTTLQSTPTDLDATLAVANAYYAIHEQTGGAAYARKGIEYYTTYLRSEPDNGDVRTDMAVLYFYIGETDRAIQEATEVIQSDPEHVNANFNLGVFYWRGRSDYQAAARQFMTVVDLLHDTSDPHDTIIDTNARENLSAIQQEAAQAGVTVDIPDTYMATEGTI
jgi:tetratricopeptide (TPR) repeat protein